jgi:hypothetical protein
MKPEQTKTTVNSYQMETNMGSTLQKAEMTNWCFNNDDVPQSEHLLGAIWQANLDAPHYGCNDCIHRTNECDKENSSEDWPYCIKHPHMSNLKGFPFQCAPACFEVDFWRTPYVYLLWVADHDRWLDSFSPGVRGRRSAARRLFARSDNRGRIPLSRHTHTLALDCEPNTQESDSQPPSQSANSQLGETPK